MAGKLVHFEIPAGDTKRAREFYGALFGWEFQGWDGSMDYHMTAAGGEPGGAIFADEAKKGIAIYFDVEDIDAAVARVRELGGTAGDRQPIPEVGWFSECVDSEGNAFALYKHDPSVRVPETSADPASR